MLDDARAREISGMDFLENESIAHHSDSFMELQIMGLLTFTFAAKIFEHPQHKKV